MEEYEIILNKFKKQFKTDVSVYLGESHIFSTGKILDLKGNTKVEIYSKGEKYTLVIVGIGDKQKQYANFLHFLFSGEKPNADSKTEVIIKTLYGEKLPIKTYEKYGLNIKDCVVLIIENNKENTAILKFLNYYNKENSLNFILDGNVVSIFPYKFADYLSINKYAEVLREALKEELGFYCKIVIGGVVENFCDVSVSYKQALAILNQSEFLSEKNVYSYPDFLPFKILNNLTESEKNSLINSYNFYLKDKVLLETADEFLNSDLNVLKASKKLYVHRNTLYYRLNKIEKITGLDVKRFSDALTYRLLSLIVKIKEKDVEN